jgi:integrase
MGRQSKPWYRADRDCWVATVRGVRHTLAKGKRNRRDAVVALARLIAHPEADDRTGGSPGASIGSLGVAYLEELAARVGAGTLADSTRVQAVCAIRPFCRAHGDRPAAALTPELVAAWVDRPGWGRTTRVSMSRRLRTLARWAHRRGLVERDPLAGLVCGTPGRRECRVTGEEVRRWLAAIRNPAFAAFARFLYLTGARRGEAAALEAGMIDWAAGVATLHQHKTAAKTGRPRRIVMVAEAVALAREWADRFPEGPIFRCTAGRPWTRENEYRQCRLASDRSGVKLTLHLMRHGYARDMLQQGEPVAVVSALLGHSSPTVTLGVYGILLDRLDALREAAGRRRG